uniref:Uncharacterized protein n=1 Tax=Anguilla anguilla TaxID=7936 RepID=A0A0E9V4B0_ANGAN
MPCSETRQVMRRMLASISTL